MRGEWGEAAGAEDARLVAAANRGEEAALTALYERYAGWVLGRARRICDDEQDAQDVLQETFLYLFGKFPGLSLTCRMTTFLYPVVRNLALKQKARRRRERAVAPADLPEEAAADDPAAALPDEDLGAAVAALPAPQREVVLLRFGEERPLAEIAGLLGVPLGTVKSRLHHALAALRERLPPC
jgi:RNA polymerase sigma-70 factor (ECF subfamily)